MIRRRERRSAEKVRAVAAEGLQNEVRKSAAAQEAWAKEVASLEAQLQAAKEELAAMQDKLTSLRVAESEELEDAREGWRRARMQAWRCQRECVEVDRGKGGARCRSKAREGRCPRGGRARYEGR